MAENTDATTDAPEIKKVQTNVADVELKADIETEVCDHINHDDDAARIVLENGNWIEYRKLDDATMEECVFVEEQHPTGHYEAFLQDSVEVKHLELETGQDFLEAVAVSVEVYESDIETLADAEAGWSTISAAVKN
jgi:hypothetical protein